ncbi:MAG: hypothetical protein ACK4SO_06185, partial [Candidatus Kapaibacteriota bacterium]
MKKLLFTLFVFILGYQTQTVLAQQLRKNQSKDAAVLISVKTQSLPPKIELNWQKHPLAYLYEVRRKDFGDLNFPATPRAILDSNTTLF